MIFGSRTVPTPRAENLGNVETLQTLGIFSGAGMLLSLLLAMGGWI